MTGLTIDSLAPDAVASHTSGRFGTPYLYEPECESTQLLLIGSALPEGAVAATDHQTAGRARAGRSWLAPPGTALLTSILLRPPGDRHLPELSLVSALATAEAIEAATDLAAQVKWPNDVMVNRRKVAGILSELSEGVVVVGIGINADWPPALFPAELADTMTSLRQASAGRPIDSDALLAAFMDRVEARIAALRAGYFDVAGWTERQATTGRLVALEGDGGRPGTAAHDPAPVMALGVDAATGALVIEDAASGDERLVHAGEVTRVRLASGV